MNRLLPSSLFTWESGQSSYLAGSLFILLFSGPPRFRERDPAASLRGDIDIVVILHLVVWAAAGLWVLYQLRFYFKENSLPVGFGLPQKLGVSMVAALGLSTFVSASPSLTAFKVYQMLISLLFATVFVERYGVEACLRKIFQASALLCVGVAVAFVVAPDLVLTTTETGALRLRGDYIASTDGISLVCLVLLLAGVQKLSRLTYAFLLTLSCLLLIASLTRTAYLAAFVIFLLALFRRPLSKPFQRFAYIFVLATVPLLLLGVISNLSEYRDPSGVTTLSDRVGLWTYLSKVTTQKSPMLGLGYYSASRVYGPQYNADLGTAHSMFFETFAGGGFLAITILLILCFVMTAYAVRISRHESQLSFTLTILFLLSITFGFIGANLDSGGAAMIFWSLAAIFPLLQSGRLIVAPGCSGTTQWASTKPVYSR
jgi:O-Antigen ligase